MDDAQKDILHALGWRPEWSGGEPHTLDDLIAWHRIAHGKKSRIYKAVVSTIPELIKRHAELRELAGDGYEGLRTTIGVATIDRADDEDSIGTHTLGMPYGYENSDPYWAYLHRYFKAGVHRVGYGHRAVGLRPAVMTIGDEDPDLLGLCYKLNVKPESATDLNRWPEGTTTEWRIRATSHISYLHDHILWDEEATRLEPTGLYITHLAEHVFYDRQVPTLIEYKKCRVAGISHDGAVELLALGIEDPASIIELCREVGEEYGLAAARHIA